MAKRKRAFNRGRWEMHRERCRIEDAFPGQPCRPADRLGDVIPSIMKRLGLEAQQWMNVLLDEWAELVGATVAQHARPGRMDRGTLIVFVDSSVWLNELSRFSHKAMLTNLQKRFGATRIKELSFKLDPDPR